MNDSHNYEHSHVHPNESVKPIFITFAINFIFAIIELIGFFFTDSMILYASSIHDIGDSTTLFATLFIERKANNGRDSKYSYGYRRFTLIGTVINYSILFIGSIFAIIESLHNIIHPQTFNPYVLLYVSIIGIIINLVGFKLVSSKKNMTSSALALNLFADMANFIIILISSLLIIKFEVYILDSLFSIIFSLYLIIQSMRAFYQIFGILMQAVPDEIDYETIKQEILLTDHILDVHDIHIWDLDSEDYIFTAHIVVDDDLQNTELMAIKEQLRRDLEGHKINHSTIEVDTISHAKFNGELPKEFNN